MKTTNTSAGRRQFLRGLAALAAGLSLAGVGGCGNNEEDKKPLPPKQLPPRPGKNKGRDKQVGDTRPR
jgi:hypothetical protein